MRTWERLEWGDVPWPIWGFLLLMLVGVIRVGASHAHIPFRLFAIVLFLAWAYLLLAGVRWAWILTVTLGAASIALDLILGSTTWFGLATGLVGLVLLLLPATRRYYAGGSAAAARG